MNAFFVEAEVKTGWKNIRDPFRKRYLDVLTKGDQLVPVRGKRKSGLKGITIAEAAKKWKYYKRMSFYQKFIYDRP